MEKNVISEFMGTRFYVNIEAKVYGVIINIKDLEQKDEIINYFKETRRTQIEGWKKDWNEKENQNGEN